MNRNEAWRLQYRLRRYMEYLSDSELKQRARDVFLNVITISNQNKFDLVPLNDGGSEWLRLFTHLCEEFKIRFGPFPAGFTDGFIKKTPIPDPLSIISSRACDIVKQLSLQPRTYLIEYGKSSYLHDAIENGIIRVSPASSYKDPSLNPAIQDDELKISCEIHPSYIRLMFFNKKTAKDEEIPLSKNLTITEHSSTNYYVYCFSLTIAPRLFLDFDADACLLILDPKRFLNQLKAEFAKVHPDWRSHQTRIRYIDPLNPKKSDFNVFRSKHFRYSYQKEYRILWLPPKPRDVLLPVDVTLGRLDEYCKLISLS